MDLDWLVNECNDPYMLERLFYVERYAWLSLSPDMCAVISIDGQFLDVNTHWEGVTGVNREDLQGSYLMEHIHFDDRERVLAEIQKLMTSDIGSTAFTFLFRGKDEEYTKLNWNVIYSPDHSAYFCTVRDPSKDTSGVARLAYRDVLTELFNRLALEEALPDILSAANEAQSAGAIFFIDLDGFKAVNDTLGHKAGDTLLVRAARRMSYVVGSQGTTYRQGGDEFIVVLPKAVDRAAAAAMAGQLVERLRSHYIIDGQRVNTGASIGIAMFPTDADTPDEILDKADKAMYHVKNQGKNNFAFYEDTQ